MQTYDINMFIESDLSCHQSDIYEFSQESSARLCKLNMQLMLAIEQLLDTSLE